MTSSTRNNVTLSSRITLMDKDIHSKSCIKGIVNEDRTICVRVAETGRHWWQCSQDLQVTSLTFNMATRAINNKKMTFQLNSLPFYAY